MAERLYWSIRTEGGASSPPAGLGCLTTPNALLVAYVSDPGDPDGVLLNPEHVDVLSFSVVRNRRVAVLVCSLVSASYNSATKTWELLIEYNEAALGDSERLLTHCDVCQIECLTCDAQAKIMGGNTTGEQDPQWNSGYGAYLNGNPNLGPGDLDVLPEQL